MTLALLSANWLKQATPTNSRERERETDGILGSLENIEGLTASLPVSIYWDSSRVFVIAYHKRVVIRNVGCLFD